MTAMIQNDEQKEWMRPLLDLRNALDFRGKGEGEGEATSDHHLRDFRRMIGTVTVMANGNAVPGPYTQEAREGWLRKLLEAQEEARRLGPAEVKGLELITLEELQEIRRIWVVDKHELEDSLPGIYKQATGREYPGKVLDDDLVLGASEMEALAEVCGKDGLHFQLTRELLSLTRQQRNTARRAGLFEKLEKSMARHFYDSEEDALKRAAGIQAERERVRRARELRPAMTGSCGVLEDGVEETSP